MKPTLPVPDAGRRALVPAGRSQGQAARALIGHWLKPQLGPKPSLAYAAQRLAAAGDQVCLVWETQSHRLLRRIVEPAPIGCLALSADGQHLALGVARQVRVYALQTGALCFEYEHGAQVNSVHFAARAERLASAALDGSIQVRELADGALGLQTMHQPGRLIVFLEGDAHLVVCESGPEVLFIEVKSARTLREFSLRYAARAGAAPTRRGHLLLAYRGCQVHLFDTGQPGPACFKVISFDSAVTSVDIAQDESVFVVTEQHGGIHFYDMRDATLVETHRSFTYPIWAAKLGCGRDLYVVGGEALVMQITTGRHVRSYCEAPPIVAATLNPERTTLLVSDRDGGLSSYELVSGRRSNKFAGHVGSVSVVVCNSDYVASGAYDGTCRLSRWSGELVAVFDPQHGPVQALALDPINQLLWVGTFSGAIFGYDLATRAPVATFKYHRASIRSLNLCSQARLLVAGDDGGHLSVLDLRAGGERIHTVRQLGPVYRAIFDADGILATSAHGVRRYRLENGAPVFTYPGCEIRWFCLLDNGQLASLGLAGELKLFDAASGACLRQTRIDDPRFHRAVVALNDHRLITGSADSILRVYDYQLNLLAQAHHFQTGVLWMTPPTGSHPGWLATDRPELLEVGELTGDGREPWPANDARRAQHLALFNSPSHVMQVVNGKPMVNLDSNTLGDPLIGPRGLLFDSGRLIGDSRRAD